MNLSVVVPWRDSGDEYRNRIWTWVRQRYEEILPQAEIIIADNQREPFSRGGSRNDGVASARNEVVLLADADTIPCASFIERGVKMLNDGAPWVLPYGEMEYYNIDQKSAEFILQRPPGFAAHPSDISFDHRITSWAGQILMNKEDFLLLGGYDDRFTGWGYEDNAFRLAADTLLGPHQRVVFGYALHIWHPAPVISTWNQPMIRANRSLYSEYEAAHGDSEGMGRLVHQDRYQSMGSV